MASIGGKEGPRRRSPRLESYDYGRSAACFITICTQDRRHRFGSVVNDSMCLNDAGKVVHGIWQEIPKRYPEIGIDVFVLMPNHLHGIVILSHAGRPQSAPPTSSSSSSSSSSKREDRQSEEASPPSSSSACDGGKPRRAEPTPSLSAYDGGSSHRAAAMSLSDVVHRFKTMSTKLYADGVRTLGWTVFQGRLWQRSYYDHVIRNEYELASIRQYILDNPVQWALDRENELAVPSQAPGGHRGPPLRRA